MPDVTALLAAAAEGSGSVARLLAVLGAIFVGTKLLGELAQRFGQPSVLGELVAGVILGRSVLGIVDPADPVIHAMSEIGVVVLLFATGLHTETRALLRVGAAATTVALAGVVLPFVAGYGVALAAGVGQVPALVCGAALCATSVGISARVLDDLGAMRSPEGRVVLGAAVIDDIVGLIILAVIASMVAGAVLTVGSVARLSGIAIGFVVAAILVGERIATVGIRAVRRAQSAGTLGIMAIVFAFVFAWLADLVGSAMIIGAFAAGLVLDDRHDRKQIEQATTTIGHFFVPIFFASVGATVDLAAFADPRSIAIGGALIVAGIVGKVAAGYAPFWFTGSKLLVGVAMVPRGEVGLIFAQMGLASGAIDAGLFGALMLMVLVTTLVTPPALSRIARRAFPAGGERGIDGPGGIDDLVAGAWPPDLVPPEAAIEQAVERHRRDRG